MKLYLKQLGLGPLQNFVYLIGSLETHEAVVVDPAWDVPRILEVARQDEMRITQAIITHTHFDHINGVEDLLQRTDCRVIVHKREASLLPVQGSHVKTVEGGDEIPLGSFTLGFLHTPGHTPGSQCLTVGDHLIAGDTLFIGGCGRCDLPGGDPEVLYQSLTRLKRLDGQMILHPGHNYAPQTTSTREKEKASNPFLQAQRPDEFLGLIGAVKKRL
jgi:glyoxylase-like metal-dependent hydrolase (beta-lactamase superfamily II)